MMTDRSMRRMALVASTVALIGMGMLTSCGSKEKPPETSPSAPGSSAPALVPTEKVITPGPNAGSGPNSHAPTDRARPAPTALPGNVITGG